MKNNTWKKITAGAAAMTLLIGGAYVYNTSAQAATYTLGFDVNPSISVDLNKKEEVVDIDAKNNDAETLLEGLNLEGSTLDVAIPQIVDTLIANGYLDPQSNSILLSLEGDDTDNTLETRIIEQVNSYLATQNITASVLFEDIDDNDIEAQELAEKFGISVAKAKLIEEILDDDNTLTSEELAPLTINELNLLAHAKDDDFEDDDIEYMGTPNTGSYIESAVAKEAALAHAGVVDGTDFEVEFDYDDGIMVYEVEFYKDGVKYEYNIDATTGNILSSEVEGNDDLDDDTDMDDDNDDLDDDTDMDDDADDMNDDNDDMDDDADDNDDDDNDEAQVAPTPAPVVDNDDDDNDDDYDVSDDDDNDDDYDVSDDSDDDDDNDSDDNEDDDDNDDDGSDD